MTITPQTTIAELALELQRLGVRRVSIAFPASGIDSATGQLFPSAPKVTEHQVLVLHGSIEKSESMVKRSRDLAQALDQVRAQLESDIADALSKESPR